MNYCVKCKTNKGTSLFLLGRYGDPHSLIKMSNTYDLFSGEELKIAEKIQQRRYQLLIHSCIYYHLNQNIISDELWDKWAKELVILQKNYPNIASKVRLSTEFAGWDASTGAFLPITETWVIKIAVKLCNCFSTSASVVKTNVVPKKSKKKRLF